MELNRYAKFLDSHEPVPVLEATYGEIARLTSASSPEKLSLRPATGKWSAREIVAHLADCEFIFGFRLRQTLSLDNPTIERFDQDRWAARYANHDLVSALSTFGAARHWNLLLISGTTPAERDRPIQHPIRGRMSFQTIVEIMAGHDLNHLAQMRELVGGAASGTQTDSAASQPSQ